MSAHGRTHWIKLYVEMLDDPKVGLLSDTAKWRWVSILLLAGELNEDGFLPDINDAAWRLHTNVETLQGEMRTLAGRGLVELRVHSDGGERWFIPAFVKRQAAASGTERARMSRHRARQGNNDTAPPVQRNVASSLQNTEYRIQNTETEGEIAPARAAAPPPPIVRTVIPDRTPGRLRASSYLSEPDPPEPDPRPIDPAAIAAGHMANAITDVTGISAKLNKVEVYDCAVALVEAGYTPEQVRLHYGREQYVGRWNWYADDWRGKKGDRPRLKELRETIVGAVEHNAAPVVQKQAGPVDRFLAGLGLSASPATS